ncbi:hypothetical protein PMIN06_010557 [Paraphaeosphaeria minitans]
MVAYKHTQASNVSINDANAPRVAVFVGRTSGIGKLILTVYWIWAVIMSGYLP